MLKLNCPNHEVIELTAARTTRRVRATVAANQRVLIHGGAGGVGSFAVQLAHHFGAETIASTSARNAAFVRELGADRVID